MKPSSVLQTMIAEYPKAIGRRPRGNSYRYIALEETTDAK